MVGHVNIKLRLRFMRLIARTIDQEGLKQQAAAVRFGTTQPRISDIVRGKVDEFTIDSLVNMLAAAGIRAPFERQGASRLGGTLGASRPDPVVDAYKDGIDGTLIHEALSRTPTERVLALEALQGLAAEARRASGLVRHDRESTHVATPRRPGRGPGIDDG